MTIVSRALWVSAHAVIRYLTRVEGVDIKPIMRKLGRDAGNALVAEALCEAFGAPIEAVRRYILPSHLHAAALAGAASIQRDGYVIRLQDGIVTTIHETRKNRVGPKIPSRRELRKRIQRTHRRHPT